jgi:hypothetical protein
VLITSDAAYFTASFQPTLYRVALADDGTPGDASAIDLPDNFGVTGPCTNPGGFPVAPIRSNGLAGKPDGDDLILVHTSEGALYKIDKATGAVTPIDLGGVDVCGGDGLLLRGDTLYVVQNVFNKIAVVQLADDHLSGVVTGYITEPFASNPATQIPTGIARFRNSLYAVTSGQFPPSPDCVVRLGPVN